jgi:hypothetical protein
MAQVHKCRSDRKFFSDKGISVQQILLACAKPWKKKSEAADV